MSYVFWILALRAANASYLAAFVYLTPILSAAYLILVFAEPMRPVYAAGLALVLAGGLLNSLGGRTGNTDQQPRTPGPIDPDTHDSH